jgi:hypothetical protein
MHRSRAPSIAPGTFFVAQSWADSITDMPGFNLRQAQPPICPQLIFDRHNSIARLDGSELKSQKFEPRPLAVRDR